MPRTTQQRPKQKLILAPLNIQRPAKRISTRLCCTRTRPPPGRAMSGTVCPVRKPCRAGQCSCPAAGYRCLMHSLDPGAAQAGQSSHGASACMMRELPNDAVGPTLTHTNTHTHTHTQTHTHTNTHTHTHTHTHEHTHTHRLHNHWSKRRRG